jgi:glycosyltransferase involved in cell wall biosynthesis
MKVLLIHSGDVGRGGGQTVLNRLKQGLMKSGHQATILCKGKTQEDSVAMPRWDYPEALVRKITQRIGLNDVHCLGSFKIKNLDSYKDADVVDLHCIHSGFFSYLALPQLTRGKPTVFTLHDMWPFTGHCHNSRDCDRWKAGCGRCPYPETSPAIRRDTSGLEWRLKKWTYERSNFSIVVPSNWLGNLVKNSILERFPIYRIPHGIDTNIYQPLDTEKCRYALDIPQDKKVVLFAADDLTLYLKGADLLRLALQNLPPSLKKQMILLIFGSKGDSFSKTIDIPARNLGYISEDRLKAVAYSAADLFVSPTRAESFGLVILESMACGTPAVSFGVGGVADLVRPNITGYLAEPENAADLAMGIETVLSDSKHLSVMGEACRRIAIEEYDVDIQVKRYTLLYDSLLRRDN